MSLVRVAEPATAPLSLAEAKAWARIDNTSFDLALPMMIDSATAIAEHEVGAKLITQTWRWTLVDWPDEREVVKLFPVQDAALSYWDGTAWATLDPTAATVIVSDAGVSVQRTIGGAWGSLVETVGPRVRVDFNVGYGDDAADVPAGIRQFIAAHVAYWVRNPEAAVEMTMLPSPFLRRLLDPFRRFD